MPTSGNRFYSQVSLVTPLPNGTGTEQLGTTTNPLPAGMYVLNTSTLMWEPWDKSVAGGGGGGGDASAANQTTEIARLTSLLAQLDVPLSTRTKPADTQIVDPLDKDARILGRSKLLDSAGVLINPAKEDGNLATILARLDVALSTRLKAADTLAALTTLTNLVQLNGQAIDMGTGVRGAGTQRVTIATNDLVPVGDNAGTLTVDAPVGTPVAVRQSDGAAFYDARQIRALTNADIVKAQLQDNAGTAIIVGQKVMASSIPVVQSNDQWPDAQARAIFLRPRKLNTYRATFRLAARPYALSNAFAAAGRKQFATLHHLVAATKLVKLRHLWVAIESASAAAIVVVELIRITAATTPATGNPAITAGLVDGSFGAPEITLLALPTTAGTEAGSPWGSAEFNLGVTAAGSVVNPPPVLQWVDLVRVGQSSIDDDEGMYPQIRAGTQEGWAVIFDSSAIATIKGFVKAELTEE